LAEIDHHLTRVRAALEAAVAVHAPKKEVVRHCDEMDVLVRALDAVCRDADDADALDELARRADAAGLHGLALATQLARTLRDPRPRSRLPARALRLRPLARELRDSSLPQHFVAELGCALDDLRRLRVEADSEAPWAAHELMTALTALGHSAEA